MIYTWTSNSRKNQLTHRFTDVHIAAVLDHNLTSVGAGRLPTARGRGLVEAGHVHFAPAHDDTALQSGPPAQRVHLEAQEDGDQRQGTAKAREGGDHRVVEGGAQGGHLRGRARGQTVVGIATETQDDLITKTVIIS